MAIVGVDHVQLAMPADGEDAARRFYVELLGLGEIPKPSRLAARGGCWFENDQVKIHLGVEEHFRAARKAHPALVCDDLSALVEELGRAGVDVRSDEPLGRRARCYVDDPFGNRIELIAA